MCSRIEILTIITLSYPKYKSWKDIRRRGTAKIRNTDDLKSKEMRWICEEEVITYIQKKEQKLGQRKGIRQDDEYNNWSIWRTLGSE